MRIVPLAATKVDWKTFSSTIQEGTGQPPTRTLDREGKSLNDILSFPLILNLDDKISYDALQTGTRLNHVFVSFLLEADTRISGISRYATVHVFEIEGDPYWGKCYAIMSGTLSQWRESVYNVLKQQRIDPRITEVFTGIKDIFSAATQLWSGAWRI